MLDTTYHSLLRISVVVFAFILLFDSGLLSPDTKVISLQTQHYLANVVGVSAGVESTQVSLLTAELTQQKRSLEAREDALEAREIVIATNQSTDTDFDYSTFTLSIIVFILLVLILLNYGLDFARMHKAATLHVKTN
jgi:hypothetical protein